MLLGTIKPSQVTVSTLRTILKVTGVQVDETIEGALLATISGSDAPTLLDLAESESMKQLLTKLQTQEERPQFAMCPECNAIFKITEKE